MEYSYKIENVSDIDSFLAFVKGIKGVVFVNFKDGILCYKLDEWTSEYDVLTNVISYLDSVNGQIIFEDEKVEDKKFEQADLDGGVKERLTDVQKIKENVTQEESGDTLSVKKKNYKTEFITRVIELSISIILLVIGGLLGVKSGEISVGLILTILAFAICGYEVIFEGITDIIHGKIFNGAFAILISASSWVLLGEPLLATIFMVLASICRFIYFNYTSLLEIKTLELFYTGSLMVKVNGEFKERKDLCVGDIVTLIEGDIIPCDGEAVSDGTVDSYNLNFNANATIKKNDSVFAGSIVTSESLTIIVKKPYGESLIDEKKKEFLNHIECKCERKDKKPLVVDLVIVVIALIVSFVLPIFLSDSYLTGLATFGKVGGVIISLLSLTQMKNSKKSVVKGYKVIGRTRGILFGKCKDMVAFGKKDSFVVSFKELCKDGKVREDSIGAMNELMYFGVKNIKTDFAGCDLTESEKRKIDFVETPFDKENIGYIKEGGDISLYGGKNTVLCDEISFVPLAYELAKRCYKSKKIINILSVIKWVLVLPAIILANTLSPILFAIGGMALNLIIELLIINSLSKTN